MLICGSVIICCLWKAKAGRRRRKNQERLLAAISTIRSPSGGSSPQGRPPVPTTNEAPIAGADWIRTPSGWTSGPSSYAVRSSGLPRLPFPQFPPLLYDGDFSRCGYPTCRREAIEMRSFPALSFDRGSLSLRFTEIWDEFDERPRRDESKAPRRRSPARRESPERA